VTTGEVVGCILLATDELLWVEELAVGASPHLIDDSGLKVNKHSTGTCFPAPVSLKKVLKASSPPPMVLSPGIWPSA